MTELRRMLMTLAASAVVVSAMLLAQHYGWSDAAVVGATTAGISFLLLSVGRDAD